jgi:hypothetical protein
MERPTKTQCTPKSMQDAIRDSVIPLTYPKKVINMPSICGAEIYMADKDLFGIFDKEKHNSVLVSKGITSQGTGSGIHQQYSIIHGGSYFTKFCVFSDAESAEFMINGEVITRFVNLKAYVWYWFFEGPINSWAAPYGQRFLDVKYKQDENVIGSRQCAIKVIYISCDDKTLADAIEIGYTNYEKTLKE